MNPKKRSALRRQLKQKSNLSSSYELANGQVIVTCPHGHKNRGAAVSDRLTAQTLVCANATCRAEWNQTLPRIAGLEEV
jgi:hypothetical protein